MATQTLDPSFRLCDLCQKNKAVIFDKKLVRFKQYSNTGHNPNLAECIECRKLGNDLDENHPILQWITKQIKL